MPAPPEFTVLLYAVTAYLIAMPLAYIIEWWTHRRDPRDHPCRHPRVHLHLAGTLDTLLSTEALK